MNYKKILVSVSDIHHHQKVLAAALDVAWKYEGELTVLHVSTHMAGTPSRVFRAFESKYTPEELRAEMDGKNVHKVPYKVELVVGDDVVKEIVQRSESHDLLVIGHEHMNALVSWVSDSIDEQVINKIHCDSLVVSL